MSLKNSFGDGFYFTTTLNAISITDPNSMQDACHKNVLRMLNFSPIFSAEALTVYSIKDSEKLKSWTVVREKRREFLSSSSSRLFFPLPSLRTTQRGLCGGD